MSLEYVYWPSDPVWLDSDFWDWRPPWVRPLRPGIMKWALQQTTAPASEPLTLADAKIHLRVDFTDDDPLIESLITLAREWIERATGLNLLTQQWTLWLDRFPRSQAFEMWPWLADPATILIPIYPVQSIGAITWTDQLNVIHTVDPTTYVTDLVSRFARLVPTNMGQGWPALVGPPLIAENAIQVPFTSGYANPSLVPARVIHAMKLLIGLWYQNREAAIISTRVASATIPYGVTELLAQLMPPMVG